MGKQKTVTQPCHTKCRPKDIKKQLPFKKCLEKQISRLRKHYSHISSKEFRIRIHNFIKGYQLKYQSNGDLTAEALNSMKICKKCDNWVKKERYVECYQCEDNYHIGCADDLQDPNDDEWLCKSCQRLCDQMESRQKLLDQFGVSVKITKFCNKCNKIAEEERIRCIRCQHNYHKECFEAGGVTIVCSQCDIQIEKEIRQRKSLGQPTLLDYFEEKKEVFYKPTSQQTIDNSEKESSLTVSWARSLALRAPIKLEPQEIAHYKKGLLYAIHSKSMKYCEELVYRCQKPTNVEEADVTIDRINSKDINAYKTYKKQPIGPYEFKAVAGMGFDVVAAKPIPKGTIICEYIGEVITKRQAINHIQNDSLMELLSGKDADISLIIKPEEYCNMARFINGVNNNDENSCKKANVNTVRYNILGEPKILLYARRFIKIGESLLYDYNAALDKYPTDEFI